LDIGSNKQLTIMTAHNTAHKTTHNTAHKTTHINTTVFWDVTPYRWEKFTAVLEKTKMRPRKISNLRHISPDGNVNQRLLALINTRWFTVRYGLRPKKKLSIQYNIRQSLFSASYDLTLKKHCSVAIKPHNEVCLL
jgi:hypothetical protein